MTDRTDDFARSDGSLGSPAVGSAWVEYGGSVWGVNTGKALCTTGSQAICGLESSVSDVDVQATFGSVGGAYDVGLAFRIVDGSNYLAAIFTNGNGVRVFSVVGGNFTPLATGSLSLTSGDVMKVTANGSSITVYKNGGSICTLTDSTFSTATKHGLRSHADGITTFDDFSITAVVAGTALPVFMNQYRQRRA